MASATPASAPAVVIHPGLTLVNTHAGAMTRIPRTAYFESALTLIDIWADADLPVRKYLAQNAIDAIGTLFGMDIQAFCTTQKQYDNAPNVGTDPPDMITLLPALKQPINHLYAYEQTQKALNGNVPIDWTTVNRDNFDAFVYGIYSPRKRNISRK